MDLSKQQRRLFTEAEQANHVVRKARAKKRPDVPTRPMQEFCTTCRAVKIELSCPECDFQQTSYDKFCRRCLQVHNNRFTCVEWTATVLQLGAPQVLCAKGCFGIGSCSH